MLSVEKMPLKGEVSGHAFNSHGNNIVYHGKSWKNHGIVLLNFCGNPGISLNYIDGTEEGMLTKFISSLQIWYFSYLQ